MENNYTYTDAFSELEQIVQEIETGNTNIDVLSEKIKRASLLIQVCRAQLTSTEEEVNLLLKNLTPNEDEDE
ncbi:exodeoxyribonuclease VII small subunit [Sphingobacterium sp. PCS056]|jgi:exodeoxyribonuclease VII small subunit|nr:MULTISPECIES: exodeoxyribonuclease VII small subunit [Sphingobacterium]UPZ37536.1 exodeoxyribonuclease VII small subunit [Sphingobacterium sp. PCS056]UXD69027.1 exodeoxyribonuclease VII small subunit [Sphingobacterium faecium]CDT04462.1 Exodeoxyribonuclease VII small subunit [Sphingobacterium sp. PM2-P1-29]